MAMVEVIPAHFGTKHGAPKPRLFASFVHADAAPVYVTPRLYATAAALPRSAKHCLLDVECGYNMLESRGHAQA